MPRERYRDFVGGLPSVMAKQPKLPLRTFNTNIGLRAVSADRTTVLAYSPTPSAVAPPQKLAYTASLRTRNSGALTGCLPKGGGTTSGAQKSAAWAGSRSYTFLAVR